MREEKIVIKVAGEIVRDILRMNSPTKTKASLDSFCF